MPPERRRMVSATSPDVHGDKAPDGLDARQRYRPRQTDVRVARADMGRATLPRRDPRRPRAASCTRTAWGAHSAIRLWAGRPSPRQRSLSHGSGISQDLGHVSHRERARRAGGRATGRAIRSCRASHLDRCRCRVPLRVVTRREPDRCRPGGTFSALGSRDERQKCPAHHTSQVPPGKRLPYRTSVQQAARHVSGAHSGPARKPVLEARQSLEAASHVAGALIRSRRPTSDEDATAGGTVAAGAAVASPATGRQAGGTPHPCPREIS